MITLGSTIFCVLSLGCNDSGKDILRSVLLRKGGRKGGQISLKNPSAFHYYG